MIYITGDTHGLIDFEKLKEFDKRYISTKDVLIILGDAGIIWDYLSMKETIAKYSSIGLTVIFVDGNHENFEILNKFPIVNKYGAKMHLISKNIFHVLRGEILNINDLKLLCIGGAISIDRHYRTLGVSYWKEEVIGKDDINNAIKNLKKYNYKVDYVLTHSCDSKTLKKYFGYYGDECTDRLTFIDKLVNYKHWYFGHYHVDKVISDKKRCFYNDILEISCIYKGNNKKRYKCELYTSENYSGINVVGSGPYLFSNFHYKTKITKEDLPEWYVFGRYYKRFGYLSAKGVKYVKYHPNMWTNHYLRDDYLEITYSNNKVFEISGNRIIKMIKAIEKYNNIDLINIKRKINFKSYYYNIYNKDEFDFETQNQLFEEACYDDILNKKIFDLISKLNYVETYFPNAAKIVINSKLFDYILDLESMYYLKSIEELFDLLMREIKGKKQGK